MYTNKGQKEDDSFNAFHCKRLRGPLGALFALVAGATRTW